MKKLPLIGLVFASALLLPAQQALAHSVQTDYLLSGDRSLALDVTFSTGEPLADAIVKIYSPDNLSEPWMEGKTDENGQFNFHPDQELEGEWTLEIGEYSHADILSVPVEKEGIQIDDISQEDSETVFAQNPLTLKTSPAQAVTGLGDSSSSFGDGEWIAIGAAIIGGSAVIRRTHK